MPYINFTIDSINKCCNNDITLFLKYNDNNDLDHIIDFNKEIQITKDHTKLDQNIKNIISKMNLKNDTYLNVFKKENAKQNELWILRTMLLFNIIGVATLCMNDESVYNYFKEKEKETPEIYKPKNNKMFPDTIVGLDKQFKLGNFGSYTKTSDIDLGVILIDTSYNTPVMSNLIWLIESLFIVLTKHDTLQYDIELYGDFLTKEENGQTYYYIDTSKININDLNPEYKNKIYKSAFYSIARNDLMHKILYSSNTTNVTSDIKSIMTNMKDAESKLLQLFESKTDKKNAEEIEVYKYLESNKKLDYSEHINNIDSMIETYESVTNEMKTYLTQSRIRIPEKEPHSDQEYRYIQTYDTRIDYYDKLNKTEKEKINFLNNATHTNDEIINLILIISESLSRRMEDYCSIPTIIHIVRTMQANKTETKRKSVMAQKLNLSYYMYICLLEESSILLMTAPFPESI